MGCKTRRLISSALVVSMMLSGCIKTMNYRVAKYSPGELPTTQPAPETAMYKVRIQDEHRQWKKVDGTARVIAAGQTLGFRTDGIGVVHAMAGDEAIPLRIPIHRRIAWVARVEKQTQFGREVEKASASAEKIAVGAAVIGIVGAGIYFTWRYGYDSGD
jgi:hypothetical protein